MPKYRKKPVVIEAVQWRRHGDHPAVRRYLNLADEDRLCDHCRTRVHYWHGWISTMEGGHIVCPCDWIVTGVEGERYPVKPEIFQKTYEAVEE